MSYKFKLVEGSLSNIPLKYRMRQPAQLTPDQVRAQQAAQYRSDTDAVQKIKQTIANLNDDAQKLSVPSIGVEARNKKLKDINTRATAVKATIQKLSSGEKQKLAAVSKQLDSLYQAALAKTKSLNALDVLRAPVTFDQTSINSILGNLASGYKPGITPEMANAAISAIINKYIRDNRLGATQQKALPKITLVEARPSQLEQDIRSIYGGQLDSKIFGGFKDIFDIMFVIGLLDQKLQNAQKQLPDLNIGKLENIVQYNKGHLSSVASDEPESRPETGQASEPAAAQPAIEEPAPPPTQPTIAPPSASPTTASPPTATTPAGATQAALPTKTTTQPQSVSLKQDTEDTSQAIKNGTQLVNSELRTRLVGLCDKTDAELVKELKARKIMTGELFKKGPHRFIPVGEGGKWSIVFPHKKTLVPGLFSLDVLFELKGGGNKYEVEKLPVFGAGSDEFPLRGDLIDKGKATAVESSTNSTKKAGGNISEQFISDTAPKIWEEFFNGFGGTKRGSIKALEEVFKSNGIEVSVQKHPSISTLGVVTYSGQAYGLPLTQGYSNVAEYFNAEKANEFSRITNLVRAAVVNNKTLEVEKIGQVTVK